MLEQIRDKSLLDAVELLNQSSYSARFWRSVREGRYPDECSRAGGRWDDRTFDVLYVSSSPEGTIEELRFHLFKGQPIPPSKVRYELFELQITLSSVITFVDLQSLESIGMNTGDFSRASYVNRKTEYPKSQEIAEVCFFLGADGILVPNARHSSLNLVVFCEQDPSPTVDVIESHGLITW